MNLPSDANGAIVGRQFNNEDSLLYEQVKPMVFIYQQTSKTWYRNLTSQNLETLLKIRHVCTATQDQASWCERETKVGSMGMHPL